MIVGQRDETLEDKYLHHIKEMEIDIKGWKKELAFAKKKSDKIYECYCITMIKICKNTILSLADLTSNHFI